MASRHRKTTIATNQTSRASTVGLKPAVVRTKAKPLVPILALKKDETEFSVFADTEKFAAHEKGATRSMFPPSGWQLYDSAGRELDRAPAGLAVTGAGSAVDVTPRLTRAIRHARNRLRDAVSSGEAPAFVKGTELDGLEATDLPELLEKLVARLGSSEHVHEDDLDLVATTSSGDGRRKGPATVSAGSGGPGSGARAHSVSPVITGGGGPTPDPGSWLHKVSSPHHW